MNSQDEREFVIIREHNDPQREHLLENYCGSFDTIMYGDEYHENISDKIKGFVEALDYLNINYTIREFVTDDFGCGRYDVRKVLLEEPVGDNPAFDQFFLATRDGDRIILDEIF